MLTNTKLGRFLLNLVDALRDLFTKDDSSTKGWTPGDIVRYNSLFKLLPLLLLLSCTPQEDYLIQGTYEVWEGTEEFYWLFKEDELIDSMYGYVVDGGRWWVQDEFLVTYTDRTGLHKWVATKTATGWILSGFENWTLTKIE